MAIAIIILIFSRVFLFLLSKSEWGEDWVKRLPSIKEDGRLRSLDAFRGMNILLMVFVNLGGGDYWYMNHSYYDGLTIADLVFPWFIYIMGVTLGVTLKTYTVSPSWLYNAFIRSMKLSLLGIVIINNAYDLEHARLPGVLQRLAINYLMFCLCLYAT